MAKQLSNLLKLFSEGGYHADIISTDVHGVHEMFDKISYGDCFVRVEKRRGISFLQIFAFHSCMYGLVTLTSVGVMQYHKRGEGNLDLAVSSTYISCLH